MTSRYMLDTNIIRKAVRERTPVLLHQIARRAPSDICVSAISYGESTFGLRRRPEATALAAVTEKFFREIQVLPFTHETAQTYGALRARMEKIGKPLGPLDMLIAAHAVSVGATLVSKDGAFRMVPDLDVEDWTQA
ncbi:type II toxin-antitoxin system VapC family toxin [Mesorhizobium sp. BAC0120]|uniref:type II toxin-antitoxin system VapC family toxin n=1 Tax=Mesorhizobium sp. BAC0120 TaxID=3090670 RepID=UPI00298D5BAD|nr:type II toxin-antitoxin system VapC family toxin [Mesorhizobium sp. BAC0120]MDW6024933.1 type II toxin-antitoxin system VapC family toxin [Mesorhizobium sp. BAC0120]